MELLTTIGGLLVFALASLFFFLIPGLFILDKTKIKFGYFNNSVIGIIIGYVSFSLASYILIILKIDWLGVTSFFLLSLYYIQVLFNRRPKMHIATLNKTNILLTLIFITGIVGQLAVISPSGTKINGNLLFWSSHGHDGPWHIALMNEIAKGYPFQNPSLSGEKLVNYHFFSDIAPAIFMKYLYLSPLDLYFRYFPFLYSLLLGACAFIIGKSLGKNFSTGIWSTIFVYFAGSFGYIATLIQKRGIGGESIFWATQIQSSIGNPPQILSDILVLTFLYLFLKFLEEKRLSIFILCLLLAGPLAVYKVYASIVILIGLSLTGILQFFKERKIDLLLMFFFCAIFSAILYLPNSSNSSSFLILQPWWYIRTMIVENSRLNWIDLELKRQHYLSKGTWHSYLRVIQIEVTAFLIFFFGNLGMRFVGLLATFTFLKNILKNYFNFLFLSIIAFSIILPLLFLQKGVASNTSQFLQYFILLMGILSAITISKIFTRLNNNLICKFIISLLIVILAIPTQLGLLYESYRRPAYAKISNNELSALEYLKENSPKTSVILTPPYNKYLITKESTPNIWAWFDTSYVSAFTKRESYVADFEQLDIMGYDITKRLALQSDFFTKDANLLVKTVKDNNISYIYFPKLLKPKSQLENINYSNVYSNEEVEIWKVN